ncbi:FemAB family PEP-CTERM system-associated protein [Stakelama saccharophila]|uniref:FemAB family PEP-CTERM system-associated protein n=2 Tax=Stakelama saccharophila TaxID=3075605 RepID=A0ABZ0BFA7_9SPHN|nr:FemAB family XrtA/PEP-CTERM system-associated protein [Stakelama sp. W311]WNO55164.1 FemAB family PEP-CTERM system-associated protein [Stakelama sp. W311]
MAVPSLVRVRAAETSDAARIATYLDAHSQTSPFHLSRWGRAVAYGCGQRSHCLLAERPDGLAGLLSLTEIRSPIFGNALVSSGFAVGGGVLASDAGAVAPLAEAAVALARETGCATVELRGGPHPGAGWQADTETYVGFARDLQPDEAAELKAVPRKQRAEIRKALGSDLTVTTGRDAAHLRAHYAVYAESVRNLGTPVFPRHLFVSVLEAFGDDADILVVWKDGAPVAAVFSLYWRGTVYPFWGGGTAAARGLRANDRMYFALMGHARARGCTRFDFGRSKAGTGAAAFKKNWGFEPAPLTYYKRSTDGAEPRSINPDDPKYRVQVALWQKLPLFVANRVGPFIARGLG